MIANFFNKTKPINFLVLSVLVFSIFLTALIKNNTEPVNFYFFAKNGLFLLLAVLTVFVLNFIIRKNSLTEDNSLAILFYIMMCSFFPKSFLNEGVFIANFILLLAFRRMYSLRSSLQNKEKIFDAAFWIGIASLFYVWSLLYVFLLYAAIVIFRKIDWRNFLIPVIGVLTPLFLSYTYLLAFNDLDRYWNLWSFDIELSTRNYNSIHFVIPLALTGLLALIAIYPTTKRSLLAKIEFKATWTLLMAHLVLSIVIALIAVNKNGSELIFMFFPLSVLFANYLQVINRYWLRELIIYVFLVTSVISLF
jgi:hypothetical protein